MWILREKYDNENFIVADINALTDEQKHLIKQHSSHIIDKYYSE